MTHPGRQGFHTRTKNSKRKSNFHDRIMEPFSTTISSTHRRPLMEKFKPPLPEALLPRTARANYIPIFLPAHHSEQHQSSIEIASSSHERQRDLRRQLTEYHNTVTTTTSRSLHPINMATLVTSHSFHHAPSTPTRTKGISLGNLATHSNNNNINSSNRNSPRDSVGSGSGSGSGSSSKTGAKCPHCPANLAYAYNLSKHIEVNYQVFFCSTFPQFHIYVKLVPLQLVRC